MTDLCRMWINQPSSLQPFHELHGTNVLAAHETGNVMRVWFLAGETVSQQLPLTVLSEGWVALGGQHESDR